MHSHGNVTEFLHVSRIIRLVIETEQLELVHQQFLPKQRNFTGRESNESAHNVAI